MNIPGTKMLGICSGQSSRLQIVIEFLLCSEFWVLMRIQGPYFQQVSIFRIEKTKSNMKINSFKCRNHFTCYFQDMLPFHMSSKFLWMVHLFMFTTLKASHDFKPRFIIVSLLDINHLLPGKSIVKLCYFFI